MNRIIYSASMMKPFIFFLVMASVLCMMTLPTASWGIGPYTDNGTTIDDQATDLTWQQETADTDDDGQVTDADKVSWRQALAYCEDLTLAGRHDWRLPNIRELRSLVKISTYSPIIDPVFQCQSFPYWSSTTNMYNQDSAWFVHFFYGESGWRPKTDDDPNSDPDYSAFVRCVRGGLPAPFSWLMFMPAIINKTVK